MDTTNYQQALEYLFQRLPMFHRVGASAYKPSLDNTYALMEVMGNPHLTFKSIHVAGTNGKGSSSHFLSSIFQEAGYKTGLYTSPHLRDFRERIKIQGVPISENTVVDFVQQYKADIERINPSFFELCVALAFLVFSKEDIDIAIVEVGMGGRLDSTNIIHPELSLITNISYDHMQFLGDTLELIAAEKAGIIKQQVPVVVSQKQAETSHVFLEKAHSLNSSILFGEEQWTCRRKEESTHTQLKLQAQRFDNYTLNINSGLSGTYQLKNIQGVLTCIDVMNELGYKISERNVLDGIQNVKSNTDLRGRWDLLSEKPFVIADTGHNEEGIQEVLKQLKLVKYEQLRIVWGMVNDKDASKIFTLLPKDAVYYFCKPDIPRGLDEELCREKASEFGLIGKSYKSVESALNAAKTEASTQDLILITGSTFVVAECI